VASPAGAGRRGLFTGRVIATGDREHLTADVEYTGPIVVGSLLTLLGAGATVLLVLWHHGVNLQKYWKRLDTYWWWLLSRRP
jgi:hypothetical protein